MIAISFIKIDAINHVERKDGIGAFFFIAIYAVATFISLKRIPLDENYIYYQLADQSLWLAVIIIVVILRKQGLVSLGFKKEITPYIAVAVFTILSGSHAILRGSYEIMGRWFFYLIAIGGFEEILFRGFAYPRAAKLFNSPMAALIVTGLLFGAMHQIAPVVWNNASWYGVFNQLGGGVLGTLFFLLIYALTENITNAILVHAALDFSRYVPYFGILSIIYVAILVFCKKRRMAIQTKANIEKT